MNLLRWTAMVPVIILFAIYQSSSTYRLNVPRVLLPYHPSIPVTFLLEVSQPSGGCFTWRSTRPDVVSVTAIGTTSQQGGQCSDRAEVRSTAKAVSGELSAVIFAEDSASSTMLSCGVSVDLISRIRIETTTKILFVDAAPARMIVEAFNAEGDKFSTLSEIPVDWELSHTGDGRPLRIVPFEQSTYEAPSEIMKLETNKKKGYVVLVEGILTGSATLTAKFAESPYSHIDAHSLDLTVVANLLLLPAHDLFVPVYAVVPFQVHIVKQSATEEIPMPSSDYYLTVDSEKICKLDTKTSSIQALSRGRTDIHLLSHNVDVKAKTGVRPPSTAIYVVDPETIQWIISGGGNWLLQTGTRYKLSISLIDPHGNAMYISDNLRFESAIPKTYFDIHFVSKNQTYFEVTPKKVGKTVLKSRFVAAVDANGNIHETTGKVTGEQFVQIVDPVRISPVEVVLPYLPRRRTSFALKATGGSSLYDWSAVDTSICTVDSNGVLSAASTGTTMIVASDKRNPAHKDNAIVYVLDILSLTFGETRKEAEVGSDLIVNVQLMGAFSDQLIPFTDCRAADFRVRSSDNGLFKPVPEYVPALPLVGTGCSTVMLKAVSSGDAKITVSFDQYEAMLDVSSYPPIRVSGDDLALAVGSSLSVAFEGGPRPWLADLPGHYRRSFVDSLISAVMMDDVVNIKCGLDDGISAVRLEVGNSPSDQLPIPAVATKNVSVCCAHPNRLVIVPLIGIQPKCPSNVKVLLSDASMNVALSAYGSCLGGNDRVLDSISGSSITWTTSNRSAVAVHHVHKDNHTFAVIQGRGIAGPVVISAEMSTEGKHRTKRLVRTSLDFRLVKSVVAEPAELVLWNEESALGNIRLSQGSGHFRIHELPGMPFTATVKDSVVTLTPRSRGSGTLRIEDVCVDGEYVDVPVKITDIHSLVIYGPHFMEVGTEVEVSVDAVDEDGVSFSRGHGVLSNAIIEPSDTSTVLVVKINSTHYRIRALTVGGVTLSASARSTSGRIVTSQPPLSLQIFSPLVLLPQKVTLIPESTFQLEVFGGPQPTPHIDFTLNNSKIAHIDPNAFITSKNLGCTSITGSVKVGVKHSTQSAVTLCVVSLAGLQIITPTHVIERGARVWIRINGLDESETPFAFGGAHHPFKVTWSVSHPNVLKMIHPFGALVSEGDENRFAICLEGGSVGSAVVKIRVELSPHAKNHFVGRSSVYEENVKILVEEPLIMPRLDMPISAIRIAPNTQMQLETAWPQSSVEFSVPREFSNRLSVSKSGLLRSNLLLGPAVLVVRRTDLSINETSMIPVTVSAVNAIDVVLLTKIDPMTSTPLTYLPVGAKLKLKVVFRDSRGRPLNEASSSVSYRPHRFDLTEIVAFDTNKTLTLTMKTTGETVFQIWNTADHSQNVFIRLSAREYLYPSSRQPVVSDIVCFTSPFAGGAMRWSSNNDRVQWLDVENGVGKATQVGRAHVTVNVAEQMLTTSITIKPAQQLLFSNDAPNFVTNAEGSSFVFPVNVFANETVTSDAEMTGCTEAQLKALSSVRAPFEYARSYACIVGPQEGGQVRLDVTGATQMDLNLVAKWIGDSQISNALRKTVFHMAMHVVESEIQLSDIDQKSAVLSLHVPSYQLRHVTASGCPGDIITITETRKPSTLDTAANKIFSVKLNIKSAALWSELSENCLITVENRVTGQSIHVPVRIRIVGQAAKQVYKALDSTGFIDFVLIFLQHYSWIIPSLMWACFTGIIAIAVYWFIRRNVWAREGTFNDNSALRSSTFGTSVLSRASVSMQSSPSFFRSSPLGKSTPINEQSTFTSPKSIRPMGSKGEPMLWSSGATVVRSFVGGATDQHMLSERDLGSNPG
ncbi:hypothetical protein KIN20_013852 [Parelaphostrongylus tenuis]|uniref:Nuclear pore membrane glycoprotein 210 n=1 Tax=Parelaphostrongylus tenuis TaxID=148309 RepID=A0AAD5QMX6_PARTN|nr:hypothetical protein KIN20_013852 [Parelaphostrongylus tenuis]